MNTACTALTVLAATSAVALSVNSAYACDPNIVQDDTAFPMRSQLRGQKGVVYMDVVVDEHGKAASVDVVDSSGYRLLDRAARRSVIANWQFDVSNCERKDLPITHRIAVEYRNEEY